MYFQVLEKYKPYMEKWTHEGHDYSCFERPPLSRYETIEYALINFANNVGRCIVELGTPRSYVHGGHPACNTDNKGAWNPKEPANWDWGAGCFSRVAVEALQSVGLSFTLHTVDISAQHIARSKFMTQPFQRFMKYHVSDSANYLKNHFGKIDLLYMDTGDMTPIEPTAELSLAEAKVVVERNMISPQGCIVIDDVKNTTPRKFGETSLLGKAKYSLPYLLDKGGFEVVMDEYQVVLKRK